MLLKNLSIKKKIIYHYNKTVNFLLYFLKCLTSIQNFGYYYFYFEYNIRLLGKNQNRISSNMRCTNQIKYE